MNDTIRTTITLEHAVALLNEAIEADPAAIHALVETRVPCNATMAAHPTIQCLAADAGYSVGLLGMLNGLFGVDAEGQGAIAYAWNIDEQRRFMISDAAERQSVIAEQVWTAVLDGGKLILRPDPGAPPLLCGLDEVLEFDEHGKLSPGQQVRVRKVHRPS